MQVTHSFSRRGFPIRIAFNTGHQCLTVAAAKELIEKLTKAISEHEAEERERQISAAAK